MSCHSQKPDPNQHFSVVTAEDHDVAYQGRWTTQYDSQHHPFQVSQTTGDTATLSFTGIAVQVFGEITGDSQSKALFGVDTDGSNGGGTTCPSPQPQGNLLFGSSTLSSERHTLFITNMGGTLSLDSLQVFVGSETSTRSSMRQTPVPSSTPATTLTTLSFSTSTGSSVSPSSSPSPGVETHLSSTTLPLPLPQSSTFNFSQTATESPQTRKSDATGASSYTISSYTEVSVVGGSTTIVVIQTTVEVRQTQPYHGPSRGAVAGAAVGGLSFLFLLIGLGLWWWRRRRNRVRFLYGISNLDFDPTMMATSSAEIQSQGPGVRDSDATLYGGVISQYKLPESYSSLALDLKKPPPSEYATSGISGDRRLTAYTEPSTRSPSVRSLCDKHSVSGPQWVEPVVPLSKDGIL